MFSFFRRRCAENLVKQLENCILHRSHTNVCNIGKSAQILMCQTPNLEVLRHKSKGGKNNKHPAPQTSGSEADEEGSDRFENQIQDKNTKIMNLSLNSLRVDAILKSSLGIARNKIETMFYESKIRVNGQKVLKKSAFVNEGDEIDVVKGISADSSGFLTVARVEVLAVTEKGDGIGVKVRRCKSLTIENYRDQWKPSD